MQKIPAALIQPAEYNRVIWDAVPEAGTPFEDILKPIYWSHVARNFKPKHRIEVMPADGSYFAELIVLECGPLWAKVSVLRKVTFRVEEKKEATVADGYEVKHRGRAGWCVVRLEDKQILHENAGSQVKAAEWLDDHLKKIAA